MPASVKEYPPGPLAALVEAMMLGDGHTEKTGLRRYITTSATLADDLIEVLQKTGTQGWCQTLTPVHETEIRGRRVGERRPQHRITERPGSGSAAPVPSEVHYCGTIHSCPIPGSAIYVRRNGRTAWCG
jgi:hypothetical protein